MPRNGREQIVDAVIVGAGACGALVACELAEAGKSVLVLEAGKRLHPALDLRNAESNGGKIQWGEPRVYNGKTPIVPKTGVGVGGGTLTWLGVMPRFHPEDFRTKTTEGVGADWPITYDDLRPHYAAVEREVGVAGEAGPFAPEPYDLPMRPHRMNWHAQLLARGARKVGAHPFAPPVAINSEAYDGRPACTYCGWCASGCPTGAKFTSAASYLARAERSGARVITDAFVYRVNYDSANRRASGVSYLNGDWREHSVRARRVILAAHAIETPRLLLLSATLEFPRGLCNSTGMVGKNFMSHPTWQVFGTFDEPVNAYKGMQMGHVMVQDYYKQAAHGRADDCARGYVLISYMMTPITYANLSGLTYGPELKRFLDDYAHTAAWWAHAEGLPNEFNSVRLDPKVKDAHGLAVARLSYGWGDNDVALAAAARDKAAEMMDASGARRVHVGLNYGAHAMGSCRMGANPRASVVDPYCRSHDVPNLYITDTSVFVTGSGVNPTLTAMAIARRAAKRMLKDAN